MVQTRQSVNVKTKKFDVHNEPLALILERLRSMIHNAPLVAIQSFSRTGEILYWNNASQELYGYSAAQVVGRRVKDLLLPLSDVREFVSLVEKLGDQPRSTFTDKWQCKTPSGIKKWIQSVFFPIFEEETLQKLFRVDIDISEHVLAEQEVLRSQNHYKTLLETIPDGILEVTNDASILYANPAMHNLLGYHDGELVGNSVDIIFADQQIKNGFISKWPYISSGQLLPMPHEIDLVKRSGEKLESLIHWNYKRDEQNNVQGFIAVVTDISARKRTERELLELNMQLEKRVAQRTAKLTQAHQQLLRQIEEKTAAEKALELERNLLQSLIDNLPNDIYLKDNKGAFIFGNKSMTSFLQEKLPGDIANRTDFDYASKKEAKQWHKEEQKIIKTGEPLINDVYRFKRAGKVSWALKSKVPWKDGDGNIVGIIGINQDVTKQKATEQLLRDQMQQCRELEKELLDISEREKRNIGQELHDTIGQQFVGISFMAKLLEHKLAQVCPEEASAAAEIVEHLRDAMNQTRRIAKGLHPVDLDSGSLQASLNELAQRTQNLFNINCTFNCNCDIVLRDSESAVHLYRIVQESLTNAIKHGNAKNILISISSGKKKCVLTIKNDGSDLPEKIQNPGMGLRIMKHRAEMVKGSLVTRKAPDGGAIVTCVFPIQGHLKGASQ